MRRPALRLALLSLAVLGVAVPTRAADIERYFPKESDAIISVNLKQVLDSNLVKKYALETIKQGIGKNEEVQKLFDSLGLDPLKDVERLTTAIGGQDQTDMRGVMVIEGKFDGKRINGTLAEIAQRRGQNVVPEKIGDSTAYKIVFPNQPTPLFASVIDNNTVVAASSKEQMADVLDAAMGGKSRIKRELSAMYRKADPRATFVMLAATKGKLERVRIPDEEIRKAIQGVETFTLEVRVDKDIKLELGIGLEDEEAAKAMQGMVDDGLDKAKGLVPLLAIQNPRLKPLGDVVKNVKTATKGRLVIVNAVLPSEVIDQLVEEARNRDR